jgi:hypothetical protein
LQRRAWSGLAESSRARSSAAGDRSSSGSESARPKPRSPALPPIPSPQPSLILSPFTFSLSWPNAWAPQQSLIVDGLLASGGPQARRLAGAIAKAWLSSSLANFLRDGYLHEKFDGRSADGLAGRGGEYAPQVGFGWSIGTALDLMRFFFSGTNHSLRDDEI